MIARKKKKKQKTKHKRLIEKMIIKDMEIDLCLHFFVSFSKE